MRYAQWMLSASLIIACAGEPSRPSPSASSSGAPNVPAVRTTPGTPATPSTPEAGNGFLWVVVADSDGFCIPGGSIRVVRGQLAGETRVQDDTPCSVWDYGMGIILSGLEAGVEMTITASASGYAEKSESFYPNVGGGSAYFITLARK